MSRGGEGGGDTGGLQVVRGLAQAGRFPEMLAACQELVERHGENAGMLLDVGALFLDFGFVSRARECFERALGLAPEDTRPVANLANLARDAGDHGASRRLYQALLRHLPKHPVIRRNAVIGLEYDPDVSDQERLDAARAWGGWALAAAGRERPRPPGVAPEGRPLRVGYVSADFCQHTVGLFVRDVLKAHASGSPMARVEAFAYSAGQTKDWVTDEIRAACHFRDVSALDDGALAERIRQDGIDVLVDLSGHTAGSRLTVFAHRPAAVQVSWLGYFATTGLTCMDAVLLDAWHAPPGTAAQFVEPIVALPAGRLCYQPVPFAPPVSPPPCLERGWIAFGSFNNTGKYNDGVFDLWARVLAAVPQSRLVLKWRTFNDAPYAQRVREAFARRGIDPERLDLRPPSFHADLLKEYADVDIALDPFPFSGGLTSCEALWMGVPVVTWPQSRVVSRQTAAFLAAIGLSELSASDPDDYVRLAVELAGSPERLATLRARLRSRMEASALMDVAGFTGHLEKCLVSLHQNVLENQSIMPSQTVLHVGPGHRQGGACLPGCFPRDAWREIRLDIDPLNEPDIVGSMLDMAAVESGSIDAIYSAHNIEHVYPHEVPTVLGEFLRVLKPTGFLVVTCPDLQAVCALIAEDKLIDPAYHSPAGAITPLDILYGHGPALAAGHSFMAHKCGFTLKTLTAQLHAAGFATIAGKRRALGLDLWLVACKEAMNESALRDLAGRVLPA